MAGGPLGGVAAAPACAAVECALRHGASGVSARAAPPLQPAGRPPRNLTLPASTRRLRASHTWCGSATTPCCIAATAPPPSDGGDAGSRAASPAALSSPVVSSHGAGRPLLAAPAAVRAARRSGAHASTSGAASSAAPAGVGASGFASAARGGVTCASASSSAAAATASPYAPLAADADTEAAERFALDSLRLGFSYGGAAARHAPRCVCPNCNTRRTRLREEFPELAAALREGDADDLTRGAGDAGARRGGSHAAGGGAAASAAASDADGFAYTGGRHAVACACPRCNSRRAALAAEAAAAAGGGAGAAAHAGGAGAPAARAAAAAAVGAAGAAAAPAPAPTPAADAPEVLVCSDGGFVVGAVAPARHPSGCACPNCNRVRSRLRSGVARACHLTPAATDALPVSPTFAAAPEEQAAKEALRRSRIAAANSGRVPWNAGRRHSAATIAKITAATRVAMAQPAMRARLSAAATDAKHTDSTRAKISAGIRAYLNRKRVAAATALAAALVYNPRWAAALPGGTWLGAPLTRRLAEQSSASLPPPPPEECDAAAAASVSTPGRKRGAASAAAAEKPAWDPSRSTANYKSPQHRARIAESIRAKWRDVAYADRVVSSMRVVGARRARNAPMYASAAPRPRRRSEAGDGDDDDGGYGGGAGAEGGVARRVLTAEEAARRAAMEAGARAMLAQAAAAADALRAQAAAAGTAVDDALMADVNAAMATATAVLERVGARNAADAAAAARQALPSPAVKRGPSAGGAAAAAAAAAVRRAPPVQRRRAPAREEGTREMVWRQGRLVDASDGEEEE
jgi:hypothetical protein